MFRLCLRLRFSLCIKAVFHQAQTEKIVRAGCTQMFTSHVYYQTHTHDTVSGPFTPIFERNFSLLEAEFNSGHETVKDWHDPLTWNPLNVVCYGHFKLRNCLTVVGLIDNIVTGVEVCLQRGEANWAYFVNSSQNLIKLLVWTKTGHMSVHVWLHRLNGP